MKRFKLTSFDQFTGCPLITNDEEKVKALPYSPFKLYLQLQNNFPLDYPDKTVDDYIDDFYPEPSPLSVSFYLNYLHLSRATSQMEAQ